MDDQELLTSRSTASASCDAISASSTDPVIVEELACWLEDLVDEPCGAQRYAGGRRCCDLEGRMEPVWEFGFPDGAREVRRAVSSAVAARACRVAGGSRGRFRSVSAAAGEPGGGHRRDEDQSGVPQAHDHG